MAPRVVTAETAAKPARAVPERKARTEAMEATLRAGPFTPLERHSSQVLSSKATPPPLERGVPAEWVETAAILRACRQPAAAVVQAEWAAVALVVAIAPPAGKAARAVRARLAEHWAMEAGVVMAEPAPAALSFRLAASSWSVRHSRES